ncbi:ComEC/Rec2 family competence protein [Frankia sp. AgB1.9]|uniref:ComEC/Rec2 family competence protein n=1 Tax=unclassified Frankia TaxID=2632575 RepID=UPI00193221C6|nr:MULTISPECIES: ComEC/Rec2 family competence protein [unclassified Frankia]MBL7492091.1 ComEC/Rec2 family competence protein [Frankia sp. AgW1.1]MBL7549559.1 ComEC/Rec2 family competence protein [Frankia sp. AgB1.9]
MADRWVPSPAGLVAVAGVGGLAALLGTVLWAREHARTGFGADARRRDPGVATSPEPRDGSRRATLAVAVTAAVAAGVFVAGVGGQDRRAGVLAQLASRSATISAELVVTDDPRPSARSAAGSVGGTRTILVPARIVRLATGRAVGAVSGARLSGPGATPAVPAPAAGGGSGAGQAGSRRPGGRSSPASGAAAADVTARLDVPVLVLALVGGDDRWSGLLPSTRVMATGRLGPPQPGDQIGAVLLVHGPPRQVRGPAWYQRLAGRLRADLRITASGLPQPARGLFPGLVDGDVSGLDPALRDDFRAAGLTHLTAVSGGNVMITIGAVLAALRRTRTGVRSRALWAAGTIVGFVVVARPSASVLRAAAMGLLGVVATGTGRGSSVLPALAGSVAVLLLARPDLALSAGFALSVLATAGIVIVAPGWRDRLARRLPGRLGRLAEGVAVAAAAQLACTPVIAWIGGGVSLVAIPANVAAEVAVAPVTVLGLVALAAGPVSGRLAGWVAWLAGWPCRWLVLVAQTAAHLPGATMGWPGGPAGALAAVAALPAGYGLLRRRWGRRACVALLAGLLTARSLASHKPATPIAEIFPAVQASDARRQ